MDLEQYILSKIAEEAGEIVQVASKGQLHGLYDINPMTGISNMGELAGEAGDLEAVLAMLGDYLTYRKLNHLLGTTLELEQQKPMQIQGRLRKMCKVSLYAMYDVKMERLYLDPDAVEFMRQYFTGRNLDYIHEYVATTMYSHKLTAIQMNNFCHLFEGAEEAVKTLYSTTIFKEVF